MLIDVTHITRYDYTHPVFCEPLTVRLRPRDDPAQRLVSYSISLEPRPAGSSKWLDLEGNGTSHFWFEGLTPRLSITSRAQVETFRSNPFDFLLYASEAQLPIRYQEQMKAVVHPYLFPAGEGEVAQFAAEIARDVRQDAMSFLNELMLRVSRTSEVIIREEGSPWPAEKTLREKTGSCRDLTVLFVAACRAVGIAARFVSGYELGDPDTKERYLHAWAEVYLPGGGWRGYDPTLGLAVADRHIALAASCLPDAAAPTAGSFRTNEAEARLTASLIIRTGSFQRQMQGSY